MNSLSLLSIMLATAFLIGALYCLTRNRKSLLNVFSFLVLLSLGWWNFCNALFFSAATETAAWHFHHLASLGWTGFIAETTYYFIVLTGLHDKMKKLWVQLLYYALPVVLLGHNALGGTTSLAVSLIRGPGGQWTYVNSLDNVWLWLYVLCLTAYFGFSFFLLLRWAAKVTHRLKKRMARSFVALDLLTIALGFVTDVLFSLTSRAIPPVANLGTALFGAGYFFIILRFDLFNVRHVVDDRDVIEHSMDALLVTDEFGEILDANHACEVLLGTSREKLIGSMGTAFLAAGDCQTISARLHAGDTVPAMEVPLEGADGQKKQLLLSASVIRDRQQEYTGTVFSLRDITQVNELKELYRKKSLEYQHLAFVDALTGLPNRRRTFEYLFTCAQRYDGAGEDFFVLYMDLNHFKSVNDLYGHNVGDRLLQLASERMRGYLTGTLSFLGRLGGDEFLMVGRGEPQPALTAGLTALFGEPFVFDGIRLQTGISVGCARYGESRSVDEMLSRADERMYQMKKDGAQSAASR